MNHSRTRFDEATTDFERELLGAWRHDGPSPRVIKQVLGFAATGSALGVASSASAASTGAALAGAVAPRAAFGLLGVAKWLTLGAIVGTSAALVTVPLARTPGVTSPPSAVAAARVKRAPGPIRPGAAAAEASGVTAKEPEPAPDRTRPASGASRPLLRTDSAPAANPQPDPLPSANTSSAARTPLELGDQVALMDRARHTLASGDAVTAARILDVYEARYPDGILLQEATLLRIESLAKQGNLAGARALATEFLRSHPTSPHAARIRRLVDGDSKP